MSEVWIRMREFPSHAVSGDGRVMRVIDGYGMAHNAKAGHVLHQNFRKYASINLWINGRSVTRLVHRLVAQHFVENPHNKPEVNHIDCNRANNRWDNLEWATRAENVGHAVKNRLNTMGESHGMSKLSLAQAKEIISLSGSGVKQKDLANKFKVSESLISAVCLGKRWRAALTRGLDTQS